MQNRNEIQGPVIHIPRGTLLRFGPHDTSEVFQVNPQKDNHLPFLLERTANTLGWVRGKFPGEIDRFYLPVEAAFGITLGIINKEIPSPDTSVFPSVRSYNQRAEELREALEIIRIGIPDRDSHGQGLHNRLRGAIALIDNTTFFSVLS